MNFRIMLLGLTCMMCTTERSTAQVLERCFGFRMTVQGIGNVSAGERPFDAISIKQVTLADSSFRSDKVHTFQSTRRFVPKYGVNLGAEFLIYTYKRFTLNSNLDVFFQGDPGETISSSKWLSIRGGISVTGMLRTNLFLNGKFGYSIVESSFYNLYDSDSLPGITLTAKGEDLYNADHTPAASQKFNPTHIAVKSSSGLNNRENKTVSLALELRWFPASKVYLSGGASFYRFSAPSKTVYFSAPLNDGRINVKDHDLPQAYKEIDMDNKDIFTVQNASDKVFNTVYVHLGAGVSLFREKRCATHNRKKWAPYF
jgi:hypothetical protein